VQGEQYFLSTKSIVSAYRQLTSVEVRNPSILHIFFILKACGFNSAYYKAVSLIAEEGYKPAVMLSKLFSPAEQAPNRHDFISPFSMQEWGSQSVAEPLDKWVRGRIKNNVIGGATTWRAVVDHNSSDETIKFNYDYINQVKDLTIQSNKLNIHALAIWSQRFTPFEKQMGPSELVDIFKDLFNITPEEMHQIVTFNTSDVLFDYSDKLHDCAQIRGLIGSPREIEEDWVESRPTANKNYASNLSEEIVMPTFQEMSRPENVLTPLLDQYSQVILAGPPGTSKSYIANQFSKGFPQENVINIQFHPSYSYQNFIGGYTVDGVNVDWIDGVLFSFAEKAKANKEQSFLLIIDEINRANVSQVFGETIQCLDRKNTTSVSRKGSLVDFELPSNLKIIGTMNTSDRTIGAIDFAIKRRFVTIYMPSNAALVDDLCAGDLDLALGDFLRLINRKLLSTLKNKELTIGHAFFMSEDKYIEDTKRFFWSKEDFEFLFNYKILPLIEDYTKGNPSQLNEILGSELPGRLTGERFVTATSSFLRNAS
jgi:5-methylcytosine-specific restriction enzyme B